MIVRNVNGVQATKLCKDQRRLFRIADHAKQFILSSNPSQLDQVWRMWLIRLIAYRLADAAMVAADEIGWLNPSHARYVVEGASEGETYVCMPWDLRLECAIGFALGKDHWWQVIPVLYEFADECRMGANRMDRRTRERRLAHVQQLIALALFKSHCYQAAYDFMERYCASSPSFVYLCCAVGQFTKARALANESSVESFIALILNQSTPSSSSILALMRAGKANVAQAELVASLQAVTGFNIGHRIVVQNLCMLFELQADTAMSQKQALRDGLRDKVGDLCQASHFRM